MASFKLLAFIDRKRPMFSMAVSISYNKKTAGYDVRTVRDDTETVKNQIQACDVYVGQRVVAATVLKWPDVLQQCPRGRVQWPNFFGMRGAPQTWEDANNRFPNAIRVGTADHAEYRVLQNIGTLVSTHKTGSNDLLVFYVLASPCERRCTNIESTWNILESIKSIKKWKNYAVVFTHIFRPQSGATINMNERRAALQRLGNSTGLDNIFRCYRGNNNRMQCINCSNSRAQNQAVHQHCYIWVTTSFKTEEDISLATAFTKS